jgi:hypothetical protein
VIPEALNWLAGGHSFGAGGVGDATGLTQAGEDFPQWEITGVRIPDEINLDDNLRARGLGALPVIDQGPVGICTATAGVTAATYAYSRSLPVGNPPPWRIFSPEPTFGWSKTSVLGGRPLPGGSTITQVARAIRDFGCVPAARFPSVDLSRVNGSRAMAWSTSQVPATMSPIASLRRFTLHRVNRWPEQIPDALALGRGVFVGVPWTFEQTDRQGMAILKPGSHVMAISGYIKAGPNGQPCLAMRQSYGTRMFLFGAGRPHPRFPIHGVGLVPLDRVWVDLRDRRVGYAVTHPVGGIR